MVMVYISGKMVIVMRASGQIVLSMDKELMFLQMEIPTLDSTKMVFLMDTDSINGKMEVFTKESFEKVLNKARVSGAKNLILLDAIRMKAHMKMTRKVEWAYLLGKVGINIKAVTRMTNGMDTVKCTGQMAQVIKENGRMESNMELVVWNFPMVE